jgi:precorrin-2/cobalt-factor-2 C20-methyltransferase
MKTCKKNNRRLGTLYGVGVGPGDPSLLTRRAAQILAAVDVVFHVAGPRTDASVSGRIVDSVADCRARRVELRFAMSADKARRRRAWQRNTRRIARELRRGRDCAFVALGDPLLYSTFIYILREAQRLLPALKAVTVPGITSFQAAAARANLPLAEDDELLTLVPAWRADLASLALAPQAGTAVFLKTYRHRDRLLAQLQSCPQPITALYAARIGLDGERIERDPRSMPGLPEEYLSLLIVKKGHPKR